MKKIVVTGGSGFIGSNLIDYLLKKNYFVINIDKSSYSANPYNVKSFNKKKNYLFFKLDICNKIGIFKILKKFKPIGIINLAAETHVDRSIDNPKDFLNSNIIGVYSLLESLRKLKKKRSKIKLLHVSTDEVYGDLPNKKKANESFKYNPSSPYSASKASGDQMIKAYLRTYKVNALIAHPCNNYGPNQFPEKLIPKMIFSVLNNKSLPLYGKGKNSREWMYVKDTCEALIKIFIKGKTGESYNIGTGKNFTNIEIIKKILKIAKLKKVRIGKKTKIIYVKDRPGHDIRYALNSNKIRKKLKWKSKTLLSFGLLKTFEWYVKNKGYFKKIGKENYKRLGLKL